MRNVHNFQLQGDLDVEAVVQGVAARNDPPLPPAHMLGLPNASAVDAWLLAHPETVSHGRLGQQPNLEHESS